MAEIKIRKLNTKDFWTILGIIRKGGKAAFKQLKETDTENEMAAGMALLDIGMEYAEKDLANLLADLAGMTPEEYQNSDFDTTLTILEKLEEQESLGNFFVRAANFAKSFSKKAS